LLYETYFEIAGKLFCVNSIETWEKDQLVEFKGKEDVEETTT
jgi:hypothetical protein